jgi:hypothetical protein
MSSDMFNSSLGRLIKGISQNYYSSDMSSMEKFEVCFIRSFPEEKRKLARRLYNVYVSDPKKFSDITYRNLSEDYVSAMERRLNPPPPVIEFDEIPIPNEEEKREYSRFCAIRKKFYINISNNFGTAEGIKSILARNPTIKEFKGLDISYRKYIDNLETCDILNQRFIDLYKQYAARNECAVFVDNMMEEWNTFYAKHRPDMDLWTMEQPEFNNSASYMLLRYKAVLKNASQETTVIKKSPKAESIPVIDGAPPLLVEPDNYETPLVSPRSETMAAEIPITVSKTPEENAVLKRVQKMVDGYADEFNECKEVLTDIKSKVDMKAINKYLARIMNSTNVLIGSKLTTISTSTKSKAVENYFNEIDRMVRSPECKFTQELTEQLFEVFNKLMRIVYACINFRPYNSLTNEIFDKGVPTEIYADVFNLVMLAIGKPVKQFIHHQMNLRADSGGNAS